MAKRSAPNLVAALASNPHARARLHRSRWYRYLAGDFPDVVDWLLDFPDLTAAAHQDALERQAQREHTEKPTRRADRVGATNA